jgi:hypothetical protein
VLAGAWVRVAVAVADPGFDRVQPVGMLKSDPALLYYVTERVVEADGLLPDDLRHDPRVQHPRGTDLAAELTVGQELLVGWTYPGLAFGAPLHVHAQRVMALTAALVVVGVYLVVRAGGGRAPALAAALLAALLPACYRTIGFVLVREDLSLPLFALGAGCAATAARAGAGAKRARWSLGAGIALAAAAGTWHAMTFVLALLALALAAAAAWTGANPLASRSGRLALVPLAAAALLVPALRASGFLVSPPLVVAAALCGLAWMQARRRGPAGDGGGRARRAAVLSGLIVAGGALALALAWLGWSGQGELAHVYEVVLAKLRFAGARPADPRAISFDARLLWQGPFETLAAGAAVRDLGLVLPAGLAALVLLARRGLSRPAAACAAFTLLALPAAWFVSRLVVLPALGLACLAGLALHGGLRRRVAAGVAAAVLVAQAALFARFAATHAITWYQPAGWAPELSALVESIPGLVPEDEAVCADFVTSTAVLAHTRRPIVLQPKYETEASRRDAEAFLRTFFHGTPQDLAGLLRERFRCRHLLVDRYVLGYLSPWTAGLPVGAEPRPGTAAAAFLSQDAAVLSGVPGYELLYRSPATILQRNGEPYDLYRLYRLTE